MRGKEAPAAHHHRTAGITPACAGKSGTSCISVRTARDHPRVCGEKLKSFANAVELEGSPPRVRGKVNNGTSRNYGCRITPACAGKSLRCHLRSAVRWDHPRVCGEKWEEELSSRLEEGSPPRVRGKGVDRKIALLRYGITPACAGKRTGAEACGGCSWDHPRVCGEKFPCFGCVLAAKGSPPRVRGKVYPSDLV